jgi:hypothetical protein
MKKGCLSVLLLGSFIVTHAQKLTIVQVREMGRSLVQQQLLSENGAQELVRYAEEMPLELYKGIGQERLTSLDNSIYVLEEYMDLMPGQELLSLQTLDSLATSDKGPWQQKIALIREERFLRENFPTRSQLLHFIYNGILFYSQNYQQEYLRQDTTGGLLLKRYDAFFGPAIQPFLTDSTISFTVSYDMDTPADQQLRVAQAKPYTKWLGVFRQAGLFTDSDSILKRWYSDGHHIISDISNRNMLDEICKRATYVDKMPYYQKQQEVLLDQLVQTGLLDNAGLVVIHRSTPPYRTEEILNACKRKILLASKTDIAPYDYVARNEYGKIDSAAISGLYYRVLDKITAHIVPVIKREIKVYKNKPDNQGLYAFQKDLSQQRSAKISYAYINLDGHLYKEVIDEKEFESWIRPENFQFLNEWQEDKGDSARFYFVKHRIFTGYEQQPVDTVFIALLTEKEASLLENKYFFSELDGCYNGSPGDYDNSVYPSEYYDSSRMSDAAIRIFISKCVQTEMISYKNAASEAPFIASLRERNPRSGLDLLYGLPAFINVDNDPSMLINAVADAAKKVLPGKKLLFSALSVTEELLSFKLNNKLYNIRFMNESDLYEKEDLLHLINKALQENGVGHHVYRLKDKDGIFGSGESDHNYMLLDKAQAAVVKELFY